MPIKSTKTTKKSDSKTSKNLETKSTSKSVAKKSTEKKAVVKRRKVDLIPTRASAVAIASQANRAKKKALIEKVASGKMPSQKMKSTDSKIPTWVRMFFGFSLLLFCVSFYQAIIYPQLAPEVVMVNNSNDNSVSDIFAQWNTQEIDDNQEYVTETEISDQVWVEESQSITIPETATETIQEFFNRLSNRNFDGAFNLMVPALRNYPDIRDHFTSFRMNPFLDGIEWWKLVPTNFEYVVSPTYWKDAYNFDISYVMSADKTKYDETWEIIVSTSWDEPKISSIRCVTSRCSYHPIFWPENFGLLR